MAWPLLIASVLAFVILLVLRHYVSHVEPFRVRVTRHRVDCPGLPPKLDGLTVCQVSDLHISSHKRNADAVSHAIRQTPADLYVFTGDMVYGRSGAAAFFEWLDALGEAVRPAVAVLGNAEHKPFIRTSEVQQSFEERGIPVLNNTSLQVPVRGSALQVVGVDDPHSGHSDFTKAYAQARPDAWTLLLCHSPDGAADLNGHRADLMLCGHTHGGQIRLPLLGALFANTRRVRGLSGGWYAGRELARKAGLPQAAVRMYVSRGLGTGSVRARLLCPPELPVFILRSVEEPAMPDADDDA